MNRYFGKEWCIALLFVGACLWPVVAYADKSPYDWTYIRLDYARDEKIAQMERFCRRIQQLAQQAGADPLIQNCFEINQQYVQAEQNGPVPEALTQNVAAFRDRFNHYYIENYFTFYDILFVDLQGRVFYSLRKEIDLNTNLLQTESGSMPLARCLQAKPEEMAFVDFHYYRASDEPAAFFVVPIRQARQQTGWIVLQCAINKINAIFAWNEELGRTGETFLVNQTGFMLTESNFTGQSTILKKHLDDRNIQAKFESLKGNRVVTDYRGFTALTSFEVVRFMGVNWLVVAKIDKAEVTTQHFIRHHRYYADKVNTYLHEKPTVDGHSGDPTCLPKKSRRVDMDEFLKAEQADCLQTYGIATCTGFLATRPGKFAYLAHISPRDKVYGADGTNLVGQMLKRIKSFDIYPSAQRQVQFILVAPHLESLWQVVDKLVVEGFLLSQILVLYNPQAESAMMQYDYVDDVLWVDWRLSSDPEQHLQQTKKAAANLGLVVEEMVESEQQGTP